MKTSPTVLSMIFLSIFMTSHVGSQTDSRTPDQPIEVYVEFINSKRQNPVDYVLGLFGYADIVILCERSHSEITQYELMGDIVANKWFIEKVGNVLPK